MLSSINGRFICSFAYNFIARSYYATPYLFASLICLITEYSHDC